MPFETTNHYRQQIDYPHVEVDHMCISLIEPYTIEDYRNNTIDIIKKFRILHIQPINNDGDYDASIEIKTYSNLNFRVLINLDDFRRDLYFMYRNYYQKIIRINVFEFQRNRRNHFDTARNNCDYFSYFLNEIAEQTQSNNSYCDIEFIRMQREIIEQNQRFNIHRNVVNNYANNIHDCVDLPNWSFLNYNNSSSFNMSGNISLNNDLFTSHFIPNERTQHPVKEQKKYINAYNYKPNYIKHFLDSENNTALLLGAEIEIDNGGQKEEIAEKCLQIMNGSKDNENNVYCMHDGSLTKGFEITTMPCTLNYHKTLEYEKMFEYLTENGYKAHDTETCGLHVHINKDYFGNSELVQQLAISKILYITEKFNDEISILGRRNCRFSVYMGYTKETPVDLFMKTSNKKDKYSAINLMHTDTIEFRMFKGTLKYSTYINTLEFVSVIAAFCKNTSIENIENITWSNIQELFSDELLKYYDSRKQKKLIKNKSETEVKYITNSNFSNYTTEYFNQRYNADNTIITDNMPTIRMNNEFGIECVRHNELVRGLRSNIINHIDELDQFHSVNLGETIDDNQNELLSDIAHCIETSGKIKQIKKEIKDIKQMIKQSNKNNNYMAMTNLSQDLSEKQIKLKKLKKKRI